MVNTLLLLQINEAMAFRYLDAFRDLCAAAFIRGKNGNRTDGSSDDRHWRANGRWARLYEDRCLLCERREYRFNQNLLKTLTLAHSLGIHAVAEGVANQDEFEMVDKLGLDGASGSKRPIGQPCRCDEQCSSSD